MKTMLHTVAPQETRKSTSIWNCDLNLLMVQSLLFILCTYWSVRIESSVTP